MKEKLTYYKELDGVRAIAALMVMFFHFCQRLTLDDGVNIMLNKYGMFGYTGVTLFFVLSGFLITRILIQTKKDNHYFKNFYIRRSLRIFPLFYFFLSLYYFIFPLIQYVPFCSLNSQIYSWLYVQNIAMTFKYDYHGPQQFWSLCIEEHFYLFWPLMVYYFDIKNLKKLIGIIVLLAFIFRVYLLSKDIDVSWFTLTRMDELAIGAYLAILEIEKKINNKTLSSFVFLFFTILIPTTVLWFFTSGKALDIIQTIKYPLISFTYFCFIVIVLAVPSNHFIKELLKNNFFSFTGKISYGLYVYHPFCFDMLHKHLHHLNVFILLILGFLLSYAMATISYYYFELFFLKIKEKVTY